MQPNRVEWVWSGHGNIKAFLHSLAHIKGYFFSNRVGNPAQLEAGGNPKMLEEMLVSVYMCVHVYMYMYLYRACL